MMGFQDKAQNEIAGDASTDMTALGVILVVISYFAPLPAQVEQIINPVGWILIIVGVVLLILGAMGRAIGGRRYWY